MNSSDKTEKIAMPHKDAFGYSVVIEIAAASGETAMNVKGDLQYLDAAGATLLVEGSKPVFYPMHRIEKITG